VRRIVNSLNEKKFIDDNNGTAATPGLATKAWQFESALDNITQGTTASTRLGNKIMLHKIEYCIGIYINAAVDVMGARAKVCVYHNKEAVGAVPSYGMMFLSNDIFSLRATPQQPRMTIMKEAEQSFVNTTATSAGASVTWGPYSCFKLVVYPKKLIVMSGNTGTVADILKDDYGLAYASTHDTAVKIFWNRKITFSDA